jgi:hypothetical protein
VSNPQVNLSNAYPDAQSGDAVLDEATGNYWVYDGSSWNDVGPVLGTTINFESGRTLWDEIQLFSSVVRTGLGRATRSFPYSLEPNIVVTPLSVYTSVNVYEAGSASPGVSTFAVTAYVPEILQGIAVFAVNGYLAIAGASPTIDASLGAAVDPGVATVQLIGAADVDIQTTAKQIFPSVAAIGVFRNTPTIVAVLDAFFSNTTLIIKSIQDSSATGPTSRFFPDVSPAARTVRVTEYTDKYYGLLDSVQATLSGNSPYASSLGSWTDGFKGVFYSTAAAKFGSKSILFSSKTSWLQASYDATLAFGTGAFTMEAWVRFNELTLTQQWLFDNLAINNANVELHNSTLGSGTPSATVTWAHGGAITTNAWLHVAVSRDSSGNIRLFVNGAQVDTTKTIASTNFTVPVYKIGAKYYSSDTAHANTLRAFVQEVRITKAARYTSNFSVPTESFVSYGYTLPTDESQTIPKSSIVLQVHGMPDAITGNPKDYSTNNSTITPVTVIPSEAITGDTNWYLTTFLLQPDGPNGSTLATNKTGKSGITNNVPTYVYQSTSVRKYADASWYFSGGTASTQHFLNAGDPEGMRFTTTDIGTIEMWFYLTRTSGYNILIYKGTYGYNENYYVAVCNNATQIQLGYADGGSNYITIDYTTTINTWHHLAITTAPTSYYNFASKGIRVYMDGAYIGGNPSVTFTNSSSGYVTIGGAVWNNEALDLGFQGYIAELRVTKGIARYKGSTYTVPTQKFGSAEPSPAFDPYFNNVKLLMKMNGTNNSTNFIDSSPLGLSIGVFQNYISTAMSRYGGSSARCIGSNGYIYTNNNTLDHNLPGDFTIECWVYVISYFQFPSVGSFGLVSRWGYNSISYQNEAWSVGINDQQGIRFRYGNDGTSVGQIDVAANSIGVNNWYHIAVSRASGVVRIFLDGVQQGTSQTITSNLSTVGDNGYIQTSIGIDWAQVYSGGFAATNTLNGYIDDVRVTKGVCRYDANFTPSETPFYSPGSSTVATVESTTVTAADPFGYYRRLLSIKNKGYFTISGNSNLVFNKLPFCVEFWVYPTAHPQGTSTWFNGFYILDGTRSTSPRLLVDWDDARNDTYTALFGPVKGESFALGSAFAEFSNILKLYQWYHIAYTRDSLGEARVFVNGKMIGSPQFLHAVDSNYTWTSDGYQNFSSGFSSIGVDQSAATPLSRCYNGYIADIRVTKGYARYLSDFTLPTAPLIDPYQASGISIPLSVKVDIAAVVPFIYTRKGPYVVGATSAFALKGSTLTLSLPSGTTTNDTTFVFLNYANGSNPVVAPTLYGNDSTTAINSSLSWYQTEILTNSSTNKSPVSYSWRKAFTSTPTAAEAAFKLPLPGEYVKNFPIGYVRCDNTNPTTYLTRPTAPDRTVTPSTVVNFAERGTNGLNNTPSFNASTCFGTYKRTDILKDGLDTTWITTVYNTSGTMWFHAGSQIGAADCCTSRACGDLYPQLTTVYDYNTTYPRYIRFSFKYLRTDWNGTFGTTGGVVSGKSDSFIYVNAPGLMWNGVDSTKAFNGTTLGNVKSIYENYNNRRSLNYLAGQPTSATYWNLTTPATGYIDRKVQWANWSSIWETVRSWQSNEGLALTRSIWDYIPAWQIGFAGGGGGPSVRTGVGISEAKIEISPQLIYHSRYVGMDSYSTTTGLVNQAGQRPAASLCYFDTFNTDITYDGLSTTFVTPQAGNNYGFWWLSAGLPGSAGPSWNCCNGSTGWCRGDQILDDPDGYRYEYGNNSTSWDANDILRVTTRIVRTSWNGTVGSAPTVLVGGPTSTITIRGMGIAQPWQGSMSEASLASLAIPAFPTGSNGEVITYTYDIPMTAFPFYNDMEKPLRICYDIVGGNDGTTKSSVGIVEAYAELLPQGFNGSFATAAESVTAHAVTVRNAGSLYKSSLSSNLTYSGFTAARSADPFYKFLLTNYDGMMANFYAYAHTQYAGATASARSNIEMPVPFAIKENTLWINLTIAGKGKDSCDISSFPTTDGVLAPVAGASVGATTVADPTKHVTSRLAYGTIRNTGPTQSITQSFTTANQGLSISFTVDDNTSVPYAAYWVTYMEYLGLLHSKLVGNSAFRTSVSTCITELYNNTLYGRQVFLPIGFKEFERTRYFSVPASGQLNSGGISTDTFKELNPLMFKRFKTANPSLGDSLSELYYYDNTDFSIAYGLRGNPSARAEINPLSYSDSYENFIPSTNNTGAVWTNMLITRAPLKPEYKGGTKKTCNTEYFGFGEGIYSGGTSRLFNKHTTGDSSKGPGQVVWFLSVPTTSFTSYLYGEIGWNADSAGGRTEPFDTPYDYTTATVTNNTWFGMAQTQNVSGCSGNYIYRYIHYNLKNATTESNYQSPITNGCLDSCFYLLTYPCLGHTLRATAYLKNGRDEQVNPAYSSARIGAMTTSYTQSNGNFAHQFANGLINTHITNIQNILLS